MATTRATIRGWLQRRKLDAEEATHMIVVCDTFDHSDYPVYMALRDDAATNEKKVREKITETGMQRIMEVYALFLPLDPQLEEHRAFHWEPPPPGFPPTDTRPAAGTLPATYQHSASVAFVSVTPPPDGLEEYRALRAKRARLECELDYEVRADAGLSTVIHRLTDDCNRTEGMLAMLRARPPSEPRARALASYRAEEDIVAAPQLSPLEFDLVFTDCETTGTDPENDEIIELAIIRTDPRTLAEKGRYHRYFLPFCPVPEEVAKINGYDEKLWRERGARALGDGDLKEIASILSGAAFVGQVIGFDKSFVLNAFRRHGEPRPPMDYHTVDIASYAWPLVLAGKVRGMSLKYSRKFFGLAGEQQHTALADVLDEIAVYKKFMRAYVKAWEGMDPLPNQ